MSGGIHGDGTYFAVASHLSWGYGGHQNATPFKAVLNSNARIIKERDLDTKFLQFQLTNPKAYRAMGYSSTGYSKSKQRSNVRGAKSMYAAMLGYNVIESTQGGGTYTVLNRSAVTVHKKILHRKNANTNASQW